MQGSFLVAFVLHHLLFSVVAEEPPGTASCDLPTVDVAQASCDLPTADVAQAFGNDDDHSTSNLHLLQRTATLKKKYQMDASTHNGHEHNQSLTLLNKAGHIESAVASWPWIIADFHLPLENASLDYLPTIVITPPTGFRITLAVALVLTVVAVIVFFITEKKTRRFGSALPVATALSNEKFLKLTEKTLHDFIYKSDDVFIVSVEDHESLTYKQLKEFINSADADVSRFGVGVKDRLAVILKDGPQAAVAFWAFSAQCVYCPINQKATDAEIGFTLNDLPAKAVVTYKENFGRVQGFPLINLIEHPKTAGLFKMEGQENPITSDKTSIGRSSIALIIQTSGTTKKPKIVPLSHENLMLCSKMIVEMIGITGTDRSLNFLPLFHIGGIANNVITPVLSHSSVICADHFTGEEAFEWVQKHRPSWYYGSPTTHMLMMKGQEPPKEKTLRCIRNATAALLPSTAAEMTLFWGCEILPAYGMSECTPIASHQTGKLTNLSTVGPAAGPNLKINNDNEILVQGPAVFSGYEIRDHMGGEDPNVAAFEGGWFHTGDCGEMRSVGPDEEHQYLAITGRSKEIIIRGGENISPFEVEDAVQDPRVSEKAAFSLPHVQLGEVVGLAVKTTAKPNELGELLKTIKKNSNLDRMKWPEVIVSVDALPKGLAGKTKRIGLDKLMGLKSRDIDNDDPVAYTWSSSTGKLEGIERGEDEESEEEEGHVDSLGLAKGKALGGVEVPEHIKNIINGMYAVSAFFVVGYHGQIFLQYQTSTPNIALTLIHMQCGNVIGGVRWTMQCFMACASYLQAKEPFNGLRVFILVCLYFLYRWPIGPCFEAFAYLVSREPVGSYYVMTDKRWFVGVMIFSYASFSYFRHKPYKGLQVLVWFIITALLNIFPVQNDALNNVLPPWINYAFQTKFCAGLTVWVGCIFIYYLVGHYSHDIVARVVAHPLCFDETFQRRLVILSPFVFILLEFAMFWGPAQTIGMSLEYKGFSWKWDPISVFMDQVVALGTIALLSQAVRGVAPRLAWIGSCALGIYLGGDIAFFLPYGPFDKTGGSFGIIVDTYQIMPTLQSLVRWFEGFWPAMVVAVFVYNLFQIFVFGIPFHYLYMWVTRQAGKLQTLSKKMSTPTQRGPTLNDLRKM